MNLNEPIAEGNTAMIYLSQDQVIKVFKDHLPNTEALKEAKKQEFARSCGLPVPRVVEVTTVEGKPALVMEYVKGKSLGDRFMDHPDQVENEVRQSVEVQYSIHNVSCTGLESMTQKLTEQIQGARLLDSFQQEKLVELLEGMNYTPKLCHGDFHLYNLIRTDLDIQIIDWVDASAGDPRGDVYRTFLLYLHHSKELAELYLRLYCEKSGLSQEEVLRWAPIIAGARLSEHVSTEDNNRLLTIVNHYCSVL